MPSLSRRREVDGRAPRFESEIRDTERSRLLVRTKKGLPYCSRCKRAFEEDSKVCPRCDTKTMGYLRPIPEEFVAQANARSLREARARMGM